MSKDVKTRTRTWKQEMQQLRDFTAFHPNRTQFSPHLNSIIQVTSCKALSSLQLLCHLHPPTHNIVLHPPRHLHLPMHNTSLHPLTHFHFQPQYQLPPTQPFYWTPPPKSSPPIQVLNQSTTSHQVLYQRTLLLFKDILVYVFHSLQHMSCPVAR